MQFKVVTKLKYEKVVVLKYLLIRKFYCCKLICNSNRSLSVLDYLSSNSKAKLEDKGFTLSSSNNSLVFVKWFMVLVNEFYLRDLQIISNPCGIYFDSSPYKSL